MIFLKPDFVQYIIASIFIAVTSFSQICFNPAVNYGAGIGVRCLTVADFDNDGKLDIVEANQTPSNIAFFKGYGNGKFRVPTTRTNGTSAVAYQIISDDFNSDGNQDVITANYGTNNISVLMGNGNGTFQNPINYAAGTQPEYIIAVDFNGDAIKDLAVVNYGSNNVSILKGNSNGTFQATTNFSSGSFPTAVIAADFNGDLILDLAVTNRLFVGNTVSILIGNGNATFQSPVGYPAGGNPEAVSSADFNADGNLDLAVSNNHGSYNTSVLLGNGNGTFQSYINYGGAQASYSNVIYDVNGDAIMDIVSCRQYGINVFLGNGNGTFQSLVYYQSPTQVNPYNLVKGDFNADGIMDVVTSLTGGNQGYAICYHQGNSNGTFQTSVAGGGFENPNRIIADDFNNDGLTDIAVSVSSINFVSVFLCTGDGAFFPGIPTDVPASAPTALESADLNGDGNKDIVITNFSGNTATVLLGNGNGTFLLDSTYIGLNQPHGIALAYINADAFTDIVAANYNSGTISIMLGNGDGTFQPITNFLISPTAGCEDVTTGDYNGDSFTDVAVTRFSGQVTIFLGYGNGTFHAPYAITSTNGSSIVSADFNMDGKLDLATPGKIYLGNGDSTFQAAISDTTGGAIIVADLDINNIPDMVGVNTSTDMVWIAIGNGTGYFYSGNSLSVDDAPQSIASGDFNADGLPDLVTVNGNSDNMSVLINCGPPTAVQTEPAEQLSVSVSPNPFSSTTVLQTANPLNNATLTVYNCFGQTVEQIKNISGQTVTFHRDNLASGLYFIRLTEENNPDGYRGIAVDKPACRSGRLVITD